MIFLRYGSAASSKPYGIELFHERFGWYPHDGSMGRLYLEPYMKTINIEQI